MSLPSEMKAATIDGYGDADVLRTTQQPVPQLDAGEVLIEVAVAGVGVWDVKERSGSVASMLPGAAKRFPRVIGGDGSGTIAAIGEGVTDLLVGDQVYGYAYTSPKGGFYAEYIAVPSNQVAPLPDGMDLAQAAVLAIASGTALRGLTTTLGVKAGQHIAVFGASGSVGLPAVQLAKALGAKVLAVVSNADGADVARTAGADAVVDSHDASASDTIKSFAPDGLDGILATANGEGLDALAAVLRQGGIVAFPNGVEPEPKPPEGREAKGYNGDIDRTLLEELNRLIAGSAYQVQLSEKLPLDRAADAHRLIEDRHAGMPVLMVRT